MRAPWLDLCAFGQEDFFLPKVPDLMLEQAHECKDLVQLEGEYKVPNTKK